MSQKQCRPDIPADPAPRLLGFIEKSNAIEGQKLPAAIPREYMQRKLIRGLAGMAVSLALYAGSLVGIAYLDSWFLTVPLIVLAGLGGWGLHCIGHDCGHHSLSPQPRFKLCV